MFKRKLLIGALAFGTVAGYASGFMCLGAHAARCHSARRATFEAHVADVCTRSAERVWEERGGHGEPPHRGGHGEPHRGAHGWSDRFGGASE